MEEIKISTNSEEETELFAAKLAEKTPMGSTLALHGNLGVGKTVFARGFAHGLGITQAVSSPTYTIIQEYQLENNTWLYHLDLYRIDSPDAALAFGVDEYLEDKEAVSLVEWAERIEAIMPEDTVHVHIERLDEERRLIRVIKNRGQIA